MQGGGLRGCEGPGEENDAQEETAAKKIHEIHATPESDIEKEYIFVCKIKYVAIAAQPFSLRIFQRASSIAVAACLSGPAQELLL
jgi:hypothetical protein